MKKLVTGIVSVAIVAGILTLVIPTPAEAGPPCVIRCSDLGGCEKCCVKKGGWVCTPA